MPPVVSTALPSAQQCPCPCPYLVVVCINAYFPWRIHHELDCFREPAHTQDAGGRGCGDTRECKNGEVRLCARPTRLPYWCIPCSTQLARRHAAKDASWHRAQSRHDAAWHRRHCCSTRPASFACARPQSMGARGGMPHGVKCHMPVATVTNTSRPR